MSLKSDKIVGRPTLREDIYVFMTISCCILLRIINVSDIVVEISFEAFMVTEFNKIFSGREQCQGVKFLQLFRD